MAVGKSSIIQRFVRNRFQDIVEPTVGAAFATKELQLNDALVKFEIWDTAG